MLGAVSQGLSGLATGFERFDRAAAAIARDHAGDRLATKAVEVMKARHQVGANLAIVRAGDQLTGTILDVFA